MAGTLLSSSRAKAVRSTGRHSIPVVQIEPPTPFVEGPGPGRDWWEKALSEKRFSGRKRGESPQNQGVGANSRTTHLGPFGEVIRASGPMAKLNPFRFSTKYDDDESDLLYYGYRYYNPSTSRWLSRDPLTERGFAMFYSDESDLATVRSVDQLPYAFVRNNPVNRLDRLGEDDWCGPPAPLPPIDPTKPQNSYNCAGCAFRDYTFKSKSDTQAKLKKDCTVFTSGRCPCGQHKCVFYDITGLKITDPNGKVVYDGPINDFHIACGNEDGNDSCQKNGTGPVTGPGGIGDNPPTNPSNPKPGYKYEPKYTTTYYCCKP